MSRDVASDRARRSSEHDLSVGIVACLQTQDSGANWHPHLHLLVTDGGFGHEMLAIDGVKLPSNASKQRSGTRAACERQATTLEAATTVMGQRHRAEDALPIEPDLAVEAAQRITRLERDATQLRSWLAAHPADRRGPTGGLRRSNRTDTERAKMATSKGVIQGYTGVAAVDERQ